MLVASILAHVRADNACRIFGLIAYGFTFVHPNPHDFSLIDLTISYPLKKDTVPIWAAGLAAGAAPAVIIFVVCFVFVPGRTFARDLSASKKLKLKLWELHAGWLGLAMSLATAVMFTQGLKLFGKPRPNCLARCQPDLARINDYSTGHYVGDDFTQVWRLVDISICTQEDKAVLYDGFQSWPSGHSSTSWSGLLYITLWLCAKFAVVLPYLPSQRTAYDPSESVMSTSSHAHSPSTSNAPLQASYKKTDNRTNAPIRHRDEAAAPPLWTLVFIILPVGTAAYIACSRYMDYAHHGFDIISGSVLGAVCAYVSFRWYHLPIGRGSGWSWGPRSQSRAYIVGVGQSGYVEEKSRSELQEAELGLIGREDSTAYQGASHE